jgi:hypothetical protein
MKKIYLSGAIEYSADAYSWRQQIYNELSSLYKVIIPKAADIPHPKTDNKYKDFTYKYFVLPDIKHILKSEYMFVKIDKAVLCGAGTISELTFACFYKKQIVYILSDGLQEKDLPGWLLGCLHKAFKVHTITEAIEYYKKLKGK